MTFDWRQLHFIPTANLLMEADKKRLETQLEFYKMKEEHIKEKIKEIKQELKRY